MSETIRGARIHEHGGIEAIVIDKFETRPPGHGEVRVRLHAAALNHLDLFVLRGIPGIEMPLPHVLGADGAGTIDAVGEGVEGLANGDAVVLDPGLSCRRCEPCRAGEHSMCVRYQLLGEHVDGTFAQAVVVPAINCYPKPANLSWSEAAAFPLVTLTAWRMLVTNARVGPGQTVLIHGIGGGVSLAALQIGRAAGATVFVTSHDDGKLERAEKLGAAAGWNYDTADIAREIRAATGKRGVDVVVDNVGAATFGVSVEAVRRGGAIVTCGVTSGARLPIDGRRVFWKHVRILGSTMGSVADFSAMLRAVANGEIVPVVDRVLPLDKVVPAFTHLQERRQFGKVVLELA